MIGISEKDLKAIEDKMLEIARGKHVFTLRESFERQMLLNIIENKEMNTK